MILKNANVLNKDFKFQKSNITIRDGIIASLESNNDEDGIDLSGKYIVPGLIDIHVHGAKGFQIGDDDKNGIPKMAKFLLEKGTTTFVPTLCVCSNEDMVRVIQDINGYMISEEPGASIGGIHLEGPYVSMKYKGALNPNYIRKPDLQEYRGLNEVAEGMIKIISMAPEVDGALEFIEEASKECVISMAHTDSGYQEAMNAIDKGASHMTHTFNAMRPYKHREPNALGAVFDSNVTCECISDGIHLHPNTVRMLYKMVGADRLVLISDGCRQIGLDDGEYVFGDEVVLIQDGKATLPDGTITGGCFTLLQNVISAIKFGVPVEDAFKCATYNAAKVLKIDDFVGSIEVGKKADFLVLDKEYQLCDVYQNGKLV